jgi:hypothetical protein
MIYAMVWDVEPSHRRGAASDVNYLEKDNI